MGPTKGDTLIRRYMFIGASVGAIFSLSPLMFLLQSGQAYASPLFLTHMLAYIVSLPWCLIAIFTGSDLLSTSIVALGGIVNGVLIGVAYGIATEH